MPIKHISSAEFVRIREADQGNVCIDVRTCGEFSSRYCRGSHNIVLGDITGSAVRALLEQHNKPANEPVYLMCLSGKRSAMAAQALAKELDNDLIVVDGGVSQLPESLLAGEGGVIDLERQVRIVAGSLVLIGVILGTFVAPWGYAISGFVGAGLVFAGVTNTCAMGMLLAKMPWNAKAS